MKRIGMLMIAGFLTFGTAACTNDEGDPEFEILNPQEEDQVEDPLQKETEGTPTKQG